MPAMQQSINISCLVGPQQQIGLPPFHCPNLGQGSRALGMASAVVWGRSPQRGPGAEAENLLASGCATEAANLPHSVRTLTISV